MTSERLPDDVNDWPDDPFRILGVTYEADAATIRRAYAELIRRFKPEHHPEQFRRIRAAYEFTSRVAAARSEMQGAEFPQFTATSRSESHHDSAPSRSGPGPQRRRAAEPEDFPETYAHLRTQAEARNSADLFLRLYWLLKIDPGLDAERKPIDWPLAAFAAGQSDPRLQALYRNELERSPEDCERGDSVRLYKALISSPFRFEFALLRLQAAIRANRWSVAQRELTSARHALQFDHADWIQLLLGLAHRLAWIDDPRAGAMYQECAAEIDAAVDLQLMLTEQLDSREQMIVVRDAWRKALAETEPRAFGRTLLEMIPDTWEMPASIWRQKLLSAVESWNVAPLLALSALDHLRSVAQPWEFDEAQQYEQPLLNYLYSLLSDTSLPRAPAMTEYPPRRFGDLLDAIDEERYGLSRETLLLNCLRDGIDVDLIARRIIDDRQFSHLATEEFLGRLVNDLPLRCVLRGCQLFQT